MKNKVVIGLLALVVVIITACGPAGAGNQVLCPLNYDQSKEDCKIANEQNPTYDRNKEQLMPAVLLAQNEIGIYVPPGDAPAKVLRGIGYHEAPDAYTFKYPTNQRTLKTERDYTNPLKCSDDQRKYGECDSTIDQIRLAGGVTAQADIELDYTVVTNDETAAELKAIGTYQELVKRVKSLLRTQFRNAKSVDPATYLTGDFDQKLYDIYAAYFKEWPYKNIISIVAFRIRGAQPDNASFLLQQNQGMKSAAAFATQAAIACGSMTDQYARAVCTQSFVWYQKSDQSAVNPPAFPAPAPVVNPTTSPK